MQKPTARQKKHPHPRKQHINFTKNCTINFQSPIPTIKIIGWGQLTLQKTVNRKTSLIKKDQKRDNTRADEILWTEGHEPWQWQPKEKNYPYTTTPDILHNSLNTSSTKNPTSPTSSYPQGGMRSYAA